MSSSETFGKYSYLYVDARAWSFCLKNVQCTSGAWEFSSNDNCNYHHYHNGADDDDNYFDWNFTYV